MDKKNREIIKKYYSEENVVRRYDDRRFSGFGGRCINRQETQPILHLIEQVRFDSRKLSVLDIGAGRGRLSIPISKLGCDVYCLDSSLEMVKYLSRFFPKQRIFQQSVFEPIRTEKKFDVVVSLRFFDHFNIVDQKKILKNIFVNLKNGGYVVFAALNKYSLEALISGFFSYGESNYFYSDRDYRKLFKFCEFEVVGFTSRFFIPRGIFLFLNKLLWLNKLLVKMDLYISSLFPRTCAYYVYFLKKI
jgi:SAM-dependent methyltransferase